MAPHGRKQAMRGGRAGTLRDVFSFVMSRSTGRVQILPPIHVRQWIRSNAASTTQARHRRGTRTPLP